MPKVIIYSHCDMKSNHFIKPGVGCFVLLFSLLHADLFGQQPDSATVVSVVVLADYPEHSPAVMLRLTDADEHVLVLEREISAGKFTQPVKSGRNMNIVLSAKDYDTVFIYIKKEDICPGCTLSLDTILMRKTADTLTEVIVRKPLIQEYADKIVYDVDGDPDSETFPLIDIMRKIPSVNVIGDNAMDINGRGFLVLVNGRKAGIFRRNPVQVMRTFPAKLVKSVEVITSPSAKYDAEGVGAVINVVLKRKPFDGYNGSITASHNTLQSDAVTGLITLKLGRVTFNGYYSPYFSYLPPVQTENVSVYDPPSGYSISQMLTSRNKYRSFTFNNEIAVEIDSMSLINVGYSNGIDKRKIKSDIRSTLEDADDHPAEMFLSENELRGFGTEPELNVDYERRFDEEGEQLLSVSYLFAQTQVRDENKQKLTGLLNAPSGQNQYQNREKEGEHTLQIDYAQPLFSNTLEVGIKSIFRDNSSHYLFDMGSYPGAYPENGSLRYKQNIYSAYAAYGWQWEKTSLQLGYRGEYTAISSPSLADIHYYTSVPTVAVSHRFKSGLFLSSSYSRRIQRPGISYLNPYTDIDNYRFIREGNENLKAENYNIIEVSASLNRIRLSQRLTIVQTLSDNTIQSVYTPMADSVIKATYMNLGTYRYTHLQYYINHKINTRLFHIFKGNVGYRYFADRKTMLNSGWNMSADYSFNYRSPKYFRIAFNVGYLSYTPTPFGKTEGRTYGYFLVGQQFFKRKLSIDFSFRNFFPKYLSQRTDYKIDGLQQWNKRTSLQRSFSVIMTYNFGRLKERVPRTENSVENDDLLKIERKENIP